MSNSWLTSLLPMRTLLDLLFSSSYTPGEFRSVIGLSTSSFKIGLRGASSLLLIERNETGKAAGA